MSTHHNPCVSSSFPLPCRRFSCPYCAPFFFTAPDISSLDVPLTPITSAKYLGSFITPTSPSTPDVNFRCSQASSPSRHSIHSSDILSFLRDLNPGSTPKSSNPSYSTAQNLKSTPLHKLQKLIASIIEPFAKFSKFRVPTKNCVLSPSDSPCSNEFLLSLAYLVLPACIPSSMRISDSRIKYHILCHPDSAESIIMFNPSHSLRTISSPCRRGAPRAHFSRSGT